MENGETDAKGHDGKTGAADLLSQEDEDVIF